MSLSFGIGLIVVIILLAAYGVTRAIDLWGKQQVSLLKKQLHLMDGISRKLDGMDSRLKSIRSSISKTGGLTGDAYSELCSFLNELSEKGKGKEEG